MYTAYAQCAVNRHPVEAAEVVLSTINNEEILHKYPSLITPDCLDYGELTLPGQFVRYGLAEALVRREFSTGLPSDIAQAAPLAHAEVNVAAYEPKPGKKYNAKELKELGDLRERAVAWRAMSEYGECVVRQDPAASLQLVFSMPDSIRETQVFASLNPVLAKCLPQGQTVTLTRDILRGAIAVNVYRLAKAPKLPSPTAGK